MKPGIQSTEFWLTLMANVIGGYATYYGSIHGQDTKTFVIGMALVNCAYAISRALVKSKTGESKPYGH